MNTITKIKTMHIKIGNSGRCDNLNLKTLCQVELAVTENKY